MYYMDSTGYFHKINILGVCKDDSEWYDIEFSNGQIGRSKLDWIYLK